MKDRLPLIKITISYKIRGNLIANRRSEAPMQTTMQASQQMTRQSTVMQDMKVKLSTLAIRSIELCLLRCCNTDESHICKWTSGRKCRRDSSNSRILVGGRHPSRDSNCHGSPVSHVGASRKSLGDHRRRLNHVCCSGRVSVSCHSGSLLRILLHHRNYGYFGNRLVCMEVARLFECEGASGLTSAS